MFDYADRRTRLLDQITADAYFAYNLEDSDPVTLRYLTGFTGEGALLLSSSEPLLLVDSRYTEQARRETDGVRIEETRAWVLKGGADAITSAGHRRVVFPSSRATCHWLGEMGKLGEFELVPDRDPVAALRRTKNADEIGHLKAAAKIADDALSELVPEIRIGMDEAEIALRLEILIRRGEAEGIAFNINVSAGENTALNHYSPFHGRRPLKAGDLLLFDFGACVHGYRSDITRTFSVGAPTHKAREIYDIVLRANQAAIDATRGGVTGVAVDAVARDLITEAGYGGEFGHGLGHGIGLEVHEAPGLSPRSTDTLESGMAVTIEPGIYLTGFGGVRIEDDVIVTDDGCQVITAFPKDRLIEVG